MIGTARLLIATCTCVCAATGTARADRPPDVIRLGERLEGKAPSATVDLSGRWSFAYTPAREDPPAVATYRATMPIPGCWDDHLTHDRATSLWPRVRFNPAPPIEYPMTEPPPDSRLPSIVGTGWYRRVMHVPADVSGRQITLRVGRVVMEAWVYVNGRQAHHHLGHSTPFEVSLGDDLRCGQANEIVLAVDNTRTDRIGCIIRGYKGRSGGIYGPVSLHVAGAARIADVYVRQADDERLRWRVELEGDVPAGAELGWSMADDDGKRVLGQGKVSVDGVTTTWSTGLLGTKPWSDESPRLYRMSVELWGGAGRLDVCARPFGRRRLMRHGFGLRLNGRPVFLRGVCECCYFPETCTPPTTMGWYRRHIGALKRAGFNWMRFHTSVPLEPCLRAADELGMLVQVEPPRGYGRQEWLDILHHGRRHPCVVIYCCGNEEVLDEPKIEFLRQCAADQRSVVPDALFNPQEALRGVEYGSVQQVGPGRVDKPYRHNPSRLAALKAFSDVFGQYAWGTLSYRTLAGDPARLTERLAAYERPCLSHELGIIGCYLNLDLAGRYEGTRIGTGIFDNVRRILRQRGLLERSAVHYRNSCAWQRLLMKDVIETARMVPQIAGYDLLGGTDPHWHRHGYGCGMLNEFGELKPGDSFDRIACFNAASVVLLRHHRRRVLASGEAFSSPVLVSWFGKEPTRDADVSWRLRRSDGEVLARGQHAAPKVAPGELVEIGKVRFEAPSVEEPAKATLEVNLSGSGANLTNRWDLWLFPLVESKPAPKGVTVVSALDGEVLKGLVRGGRVVLLGSKPFKAQKTSFQIAIAGRPSGNLATVVADHPLTRRFPHDGICGWPFRAMLDGGAAVVFDEMPEAFDPIVEVVHTYKNPMRQAAVFEWRVGRGRLLVCSLDLSGSDPATRFFRGMLLDYAAGSDFSPRTEVAFGAIARYLNLSLPGLEQQRPTDEAADPRVRTPAKP